MENPEGAVAGNSQNTPTANVPRTFSTFPLKYHLFDTHRFGEYHPHYVEDSVKNDTLPIRSSHNVMSYTLKAPLMQDITMYKDYFSVPMEAILPLNWEKIFDNPVRGDDVSVDVGPTVENFWSKVSSVFTSLYNALITVFNDQTARDVDKIQCLFRFLVVTEYFYSNGSLMSSLGCHGSPYINFTDSNNVGRSYDYFFDHVVSAFLGDWNDDEYFITSLDGYSYTVVKDEVLSQNIGHSVIGFRHFLSIIRDNPTFVVTASTIDGSALTSAFTAVGDFTYGAVAANVPFNMSRLWAYQLCCAHYYSNDHIDFVYSAELYRQLIGNYIVTIFQSGFQTNMFFSRNGVRYQYDYLSAKPCTTVLGWIAVAANSVLLLNTNGNSTALAILGYLSALFAYRRSLRYQDYFTGSRAQPLAVGSTGVTVSGNTVDVVDITRNIQRQRFLNAVNRVRHNFEGYLQGIFGGDVPAPDYHNPFFLASTNDSIYGQETENTGADQLTRSLSITTNLRSNGSRYMLEIHSDRPCIVIGITHYDLPRVYSKSMERSFLHKDRFDMFNPFMQYIGDQQIYIQELGINPNLTNLLAMNNFSYTLRHMEYKQRYNQCSGAFVENLPGFVFVAKDERGTQYSINPDWIRSVTSEFDNFFVSLNGWSNGSYFHFIVDNYNDCSGQRPMAYAPSIL